MRLPNTKQFSQNTLQGYQVELVSGDFAVDGDLNVKGVDFPDLPIGSTYWKKVTANQIEYVIKAKDDNRDDDFVVLRGVICQRVELADFTDGGGATGTVVLNATIPKGVLFERTFVTNVTDFVGSAAVELDVGDGTDPARYNSATAPSVAATDASVDAGAPSGTVYHDAAIATVTVTVTDDSDFGDITSGAATITMFYYGATA